MRVMGILLIATFSGGPIGRAQEPEAPPNEPPHLWRASASERDGQVIVRIANPEYVTPRNAVPAEAMRWRELKPVALGGSATCLRGRWEAIGGEGPARRAQGPEGRRSVRTLQPPSPRAGPVLLGDAPRGHHRPGRGRRSHLRPYPVKGIHPRGSFGTSSAANKTKRGDAALEDGGRSTTENTENTEENPSEFVFIFRVFRVFRGSISLPLSRVMRVGPAPLTYTPTGYRIAMALYPRGVYAAGGPRWTAMARRR